MTGDSGSLFYVVIAAEVNGDDLVADIVYDGDQIASATSTGGEWTLTIYDRSGPGERCVPLDGMIRALQEAASKLR